MLLHVARATSKDEPSSPAHMAVRNTIIEAMNGPCKAEGECSAVLSPSPSLPPSRPRSPRPRHPLSSFSRSALGESDSTPPPPSPSRLVVASRHRQPSLWQSSLNPAVAAAPAKFLPLLEDGANWCDPYPSCHHGKANISAFLDGMPVGTDAALLAGPMVTVGSVGGFMSTVSFALPGTDPSCLYTADQHISWNLSSIVSGARAGVAAPKLSYIRWVYNASQWATVRHSILDIVTYVEPFLRGGREG